MNIKEISTRLDILTLLANEDKQKNAWLSGTVRFKIASNLSALSKISYEFDAKRVALVKEFGEPEAPGSDKYAVKDPEKLKEFQSKLEPLLNEEHTIKIETVSKKDILGKSGDNQFSLDVISDLITLGLITK